MVKTIVGIDGMMCGMCESHVNDVIRKSFDVKKVSSSHSKKRTEIISEEALDEDKIRAVIDETGYTVMSVETEPYKKKFGLLKKVFLSKKYNDSLVRKLSAGELTVAQLKQINRAIKSGLSDKQLNSIINSKKDASRMSVIIDIAINVNKMNQKEVKC